MKQILFFGDSLTAGYGLQNPSQDSLPALTQQRIAENGLNYTVFNAGVSGNTSGDGLTRIDNVIYKPVDIFVLELGANDLLKGYPPQWTKNNLQLIINKVKALHSQADLLILGMQLPEWVPGANVAETRKIYKELSTQNNAELVPFFLDGVAGIKHLNMVDGIHPLAEGYKIIAANVWPSLLKLIEKGK